MSETVKPCPFCGAEPQFTNPYYDRAKCSNPGCPAHGYWTGTDQWNRRAGMVTGRDVHAAWRDGMLGQHRAVAPERMAWDTLSQQDRDLDEAIAARLLSAPPLPATKEGKCGCGHGPSDHAYNGAPPRSSHCVRCGCDGYREDDRCFCGHGQHVHFHEKDGTQTICGTAGCPCPLYRPAFKREGK
jgi:hypothetical protein